MAPGPPYCCCDYGVGHATWTEGLTEDPLGFDVVIDVVWTNVSAEVTACEVLVEHSRAYCCPKCWLDGEGMFHDRGSLDLIGGLVGYGGLVCELSIWRPTC